MVIYFKKKYVMQILFNCQVIKITLLNLKLIELVGFAKVMQFFRYKVTVEYCGKGHPFIWLFDKTAGVP